MFCSKEQIRDEVWAQMRASLDETGTNLLDDANVLGWFLDPAIQYPNPTEATTAIENLFLASDYVRTNTDLATMEGANEAARRAVNGVLAASGSSQPVCRTWSYSEPELFAPLRALDWVFYALGQPPRQLVRFRDGQLEASTLSALGGPVRELLSAGT